MIGERERSIVAEGRLAKQQLSRTMMLFVWVVVFLLGMLLRFAAVDKLGFAWQAAREVGSFMAVTMAVAFIYETFLRSRERSVFIDDLEDLLERKMEGERRGIKIFDDGRPALEEKLKVINEAQREIVEIGTALRTFVSYFEQRPSSDFRDHIIWLLRKGVILRCVLLDPNAACMPYQPPNTHQKSSDSLHALTRLKKEFETLQLKGRLEILLVDSAPRFAAICVDADTDAGQIFFAPYIFSGRRAEEPTFLIRKADRSRLFSKIWAAVNEQTATARPVTEQFASAMMPQPAAERSQDR